MHSIDIHAHLWPQAYLHAVANGKTWHGLKGDLGLGNPKTAWTPAQRLADMR